MIEVKDLKKAFGKLEVLKGITETIQWYLDNQDWTDQVKSGDYQKYYEKMYGER